MRWLGKLAEPLRPHLLPSFLIVGAQKAGTSALFKMLAQHPKVIAPKVKELEFFTDAAYATKSIRDYTKLFPVRPLRGNGYTTFEATPSYLFDPLVPQRIHDLFPNMHIVVVLRDPVRRAFSAWNMFRQFEHHKKYAALFDPRSFEQAVEEERVGVSVRSAHRYLAYGNYAEQLLPYLRLFGRDHVHVVNYKDLKRDPATQLQGICAALGLPPFPVGLPTQVKANERPYADRMSPEVAAQLSSHFAPGLLELDALLGAPIDLLEPPLV